jgi:hypothetical protein
VSVCEHCRAPIDDTMSDCLECGRPLGSRPIERHGYRFKIWRGTELPPVCVRCGAPAREKPWKRSFYWHEPALYLTILLGVLVYVIIAVVVRKRIDLDVPMCEAHWRRRALLRKVSYGMLALAVGLVVLAFSVRGEAAPGFACLGSFVTGVAALFVHGAADRSIQPKRITDDYAEFAGASPQFLAVLD